MTIFLDPRFCHVPTYMFNVYAPCFLLEAASIRRKLGDQDQVFSAKCESYAEACRLRFRLADLVDGVMPAKINNAVPRTPTFEVEFFPISDGPSTSKYRDAVYSMNSKILVALGRDHTEHDSTVNQLDKKSLCNMALQHLLKQTEDSRAKYAHEFKGMLVEKLMSKYDVIESFVGDELFDRHSSDKGVWFNSLG